MRLTLLPSMGHLTSTGSSKRGGKHHTDGRADACLMTWMTERGSAALYSADVVLLAAADAGANAPIKLMASNQTQTSCGVGAPRQEVL